MFKLDDRTGNIITTVGLFIAVAAFIYLSRVVVLVSVMSVLLAYLLEPAVTWMQHHSRFGRKNRSWAIGQVYAICGLALGGVGYALGPKLVAQAKNLSAFVLQLRELWAQHQDLLTRVFERGAASAAAAGSIAVWLFVIPILAIFFLNDGRAMAEAILTRVGPRNRTLVSRIAQKIDAMLARYVRAQSALAALSFGFYIVTMLLLRFPYAGSLAVLGAVMEFVPIIGWITTAGIIVTIGVMTHAHWIWMAGLVVMWRLVQSYVNAPRIMGKTLGLQPLTIILALMAGGQVAGILGVYLSVPTAAVLRIVFLEYFSYRNSSAAPAA
jgi:predicted PurR-regulated permease PerM